ncbi:hypothetical protein [Halorussus sp. AFM4]|uniref:hypothetical protein n=1 Tax=Halorussus sp. AFM4 TaxID=3421651 RepID=UPI003EB89C9B
MQLPNVDRFSGTERFAIGAVLTVAVSVLVESGIGLFRFGGMLQLLAWAFLGTALLPPFVSYLDADGWDDVSTTKQIGILWIAGVGALVLWFLISQTAGRVVSVVV